MDLARAPRRRPLTARKKGSGYENAASGNRQFQLLVYSCRGRWEVRYHIADNAEKIKMVINTD